MIAQDPSFEPNTVPVTFSTFSVYDDDQNQQGPKIDINKLVDDAWSKIMMSLDTN